MGRHLATIILLAAASGALGLYWYVALWEESAAEGRVHLPVTAIVIPHHDMVAPARLAYLQTVAATTRPDTIVIVSPDHFDRASAPIVASDQVWQTIHGELPVAETLLGNLPVMTESAAFAGEHGVTSIVGDIRQAFGAVPVVALLLQRQATYAEVVALVEALEASCTACLVVASVDFSHTAVADVAWLHDLTTIRLLHDADPVALYQHAEVDSPESLAVVALWNERQGAQPFRVFSHTNSGYLTGTDTGEITTHIIGGYGVEAVERVPIDSSVTTFMIGGDTMFARGVATAHAAQPSQAIVSGIGERFFWGADLRLVNLEGVFYTEDDVTRRQGWQQMPPLLRFAPVYARALQAARLTHVSVANNHQADAGEAGLYQTHDTVRLLGIESVGDAAPLPRAAIVNASGTPVAVVPVSLFSAQTDIAATVRDYSAAGFRVIAYVHWGQEYETTPAPTVRYAAERLIDAGADLVVGSHPHVVQKVSVYKEVPIVYSLGNFLFDQSFGSTSQGAVLGGVFSDIGLTLTMVPIQTYLTPSVVPEPQFSVLRALWTTAWQPYQVASSTTYFFPVSGQSPVDGSTTVVE